MEGKKPVGVCEALNKYSSGCDKCLMFSGLLVAFVQGAGMPMLFFVMKDMIGDMGSAAAVGGELQTGTLTAAQKSAM